MICEKNNLTTPKQQNRDSQGAIYPAVGNQNASHLRTHKLSYRRSIARSYSSCNCDCDALDRRVSKTVSGGPGTTWYLHDGDEEIAKYGGGSTGTLTSRYIMGPATDDRIAHIVVNAGASYRSFYHLNPQGSVNEMTDVSGSLTGCAASFICQRRGATLSQSRKLPAEQPTLFNVRVGIWRDAGQRLAGKGHDLLAVLLNQLSQRRRPQLNI